MRCPACDSAETVAYEYGDSTMSFLLKTYYPKARDCTSCGYVWDEARRQDEATMRELLGGLSKLRKDKP